MTKKQHSERAGKYRGYVITPVYFAGSDFTVTKDNCIKTRKPTKADVEYYEFTEVGEEQRQGAEFTVGECKARIDALHAAVEYYEALIDGLVRVHGSLKKALKALAPAGALPLTFLEAMELAAAPNDRGGPCTPT
jgi:hypothetical protein